MVPIDVRRYESYCRFTDRPTSNKPWVELRYPIRSVTAGYAAYVNQVFALLGIHREHLDWRQHAAGRPC